MQYLGSKNKIAKHLLPIILENRKPKQWYVEPFVGGCNMIDKVSGNRIGGDSHYYLIEMWKALQNGWTPPKFISEKRYAELKANKEVFNPALVGYAGFTMAFGSKWMDGYTRSHNLGNQNEIKKSMWAYKNVTKQIPLIMGVKFFQSQFFKLVIPKNSIIYCDPPYENTTAYKDNVFDYSLFWDWIRHLNKQGHSVFISGYKAPSDFTSLISIKKSASNALKQDNTEQLFVWKYQNKYL
jgi:DNA adenine methylase